MKRSQAARYARWSAALALALAAVTVAVYVQHGVVARWQNRKAPPAAPLNVERQSNGLTFSKVEGERKIFTVEASKSTEFRNQEASLLEEVKITIFGQQGARHDIIRTHSCQYAKANGSIACSGTVQMDLQSAADAARHDKGKDGPPAAHVETRNVTFNQASGTAQTSERVTFTFPAGNGEAVGVEYNSQQGLIKLLHDVKMNLVQTSGPKGTAGKEVRVTGTSLEFSRDTRLLHLAGPAEAHSQTAELNGGDITMSLDEDYRAQKLFATSGTSGRKPRASSSSANGAMRVSANVLTAWFDNDGGLKKLDAAGSVEGSRKTGGEDDVFSAANCSLDLWPEVSQPRQMDLTGNVVLKAVAQNGQERRLETDEARMEFTTGSDDRPSRPKRAETLAPGVIQWLDASVNGGDGKANTAAQTKLRADKLLLDFSGGAATQLAATGNVQAERGIKGGPLEVTTAKRGVAQLVANGGWSQISMDDNVKFKAGDRSGQADHAVAVRATQTTTLTGQAIVRDATTETRANRINFEQNTGDIHADGKVHTVTLSDSGGEPRSASASASILADVLQANSKTGRALYSGHARMYQGDSVLESDAVELSQKTREINATGNVRAVFPQASARFSTNGATPAGGAAPVNNKAGKKGNPWHVSSKTLHYDDQEERAHLEGNVVVQSEAQRMRSSLLDLYFTRAKPSAAEQLPAGRISARQEAPGASAISFLGAQQISRAVGTGGVIVEEQDRKATAERAEYTAAEGKFVMSGGASDAIRRHPR